MRLDSFWFIFLFLPAAAISYRLIRTRLPGTAPLMFLSLASALFYAASSPGTLPLVAGSLLFNWLAARRIAAAGARGARLWLIAGLAANVAFLAWFKYAGRALGPEFAPRALPLGISFFTLQQIMYLLDTQQRLCAPNSLAEQAAFISYFPYVASGPIARAKDVVSQFRAGTAASPDDLSAGLSRFAIGLFKKTAFADTLGGIADAGFASASSLSFAESWLFSIVYTLHLYFDFSGYTDMAVGASRLFGIRIPENFNHPFRARTISEFWQRWHMTLTRFITAYLYTPIVRSFPNPTTAASAFAVFCAMTIAGVWHGAGLPFLVFGAWHGAALAVNQLWRASRKRLPDWAGWALTFATVVIGMTIFRSPNMGTAYQMLTAMAGAHGLAGLGHFLGAVAEAGGPIAAVTILTAAIAAFFGPTSAKLAAAGRLTPQYQFAAAAITVITLVFLASGASKGFVYVNF